MIYIVQIKYPSFIVRYGNIIGFLFLLILFPFDETFFFTLRLALHKCVHQK